MNQIKGIKSQSKKIYPSAIKKREGGKWVKIKVNKVGEKEGKGSSKLWVNCCLYWLDAFVAYSFQHLPYITSLAGPITTWIAWIAWNFLVSIRI